jgi:hypothetical protein
MENYYQFIHREQPEHINKNLNDIAKKYQLFIIITKFPDVRYSLFRSVIYKVKYLKTENYKALVIVIKVSRVLYG